MRKLSLIIALLLLSIPAWGQAPVISPAIAPAVNQGQTTTFSCSANGPCTWTCTTVGGCLGSIVAGTGVYTAPATVNSQQSWGGCQLLPNDHIFNTRIDGLAVDPNSAAWIAGAGTVPVNYLPAFPTTYVNGSTPSQTMTFTLSPTQSGSFFVPGWPDLNVQSGYYTYINNYTPGHTAAFDQHVLTVNPSGCTMQEWYGYYPDMVLTGASVNGTAYTFTTSGNPLTNKPALFPGVQIGTAGFTGADAAIFNISAGTLTVATVSSTGFTATGPSHAIATASTTGTFTQDFSCAAQNCNSRVGLKYQNSSYTLPTQGGVNAGGTIISPLVLRIQELENAIATGGTIKHALTMTLQNGFICNSSILNACGNNPAGTRHIWPATSEAFAGGGIIPYGARFRLKAAFNCAFRNGVSGTAFSAGAQVLCLQLQQYGLILTDGGFGWQIGTESGAYRQDAYAGGFSSGVTPANDIFQEMAVAAIATSNFEAVNESSLMVVNTSGATTNAETITATAAGGTATQNVVLTGVTLNLPRDGYNIMAGTPAQQLVAYVNGSANTAVTWTMSPTVGTLTSGGLYTPPASVANTTIATITATSAANTNVIATMQLSVFTAHTIRIAEGLLSPYTDASANVWQPRSINGGGGDYASYGQQAIAGVVAGVDGTLYQKALGAYDDTPYHFIVPNGNYQITEKFAETSGVNAPNIRVFTIEAEGITEVFNLDLFALVGSDVQHDVTFNVAVTNNDLYLNNRFMKGLGGQILNALQIVQVRGQGGVSIGSIMPPINLIAGQSAQVICAPVK